MKDTDIFWKGSAAVDSARTWIAIFSWITIITGILIAVINVFEFEIFLAGCCVIGVGISGLILRNVLRGFGTIVKASEAYLKDREDKKESEKAE